ncbi:hypothetical protein M885DRAFT_517019 [Pelagophyceae sp. CCMP2097]|nr:hypothetical protein M885DRAFT_517019 [Pelagophyceae sp. CCMP2097]|mmetsp:Transcript_2318/g.8447  ORF Transcript_2318/g.8447 Transcript_2318/m.8447 type:complete len:244 (-) Transcript_2318:17-748(-)
MPPAPLRSLASTRGQSRGRPSATLATSSHHAVATISSGTTRFAQRRATVRRSRETSTGSPAAASSKATDEPGEPDHTGFEPPALETAVRADVRQTPPSSLRNTSATTSCGRIQPRSSTPVAQWNSTTILARDRGRRRLGTSGLASSSSACDASCTSMASASAKSSIDLSHVASANSSIGCATSSIEARPACCSHIATMRGKLPPSHRAGLLVGRASPRSVAWGEHGRLRGPEAAAELRAPRSC